MYHTLYRWRLAARMMKAIGTWLIGSVTGFIQRRKTSRELRKQRGNMTGFTE